MGNPANIPIQPANMPVCQTLSHSKSSAFNKATISSRRRASSLKAWCRWKTV